jgi:hypothetical protein
LLVHAATMRTAGSPEQSRAWVVARTTTLLAPGGTETLTKGERFGGGRGAACVTDEAPTRTVASVTRPIETDTRRSM